MERKPAGWMSAATAATLGLKEVLAPASVLGANERIQMASIGVGGMGGHHLGRMTDMANDPNGRVQVVAVCDVWDARLEGAENRSGAEGYKDYRRLLERNDVDAVVIATPDHWHSTISIDAMEAGKDVYCEKPMTLYWEQAKAVAETARRTGRVFQCGVQSSSEDRWWKAQELIRRGVIGHLIWTTGGAFRNDPGGDWNWGIDPGANPDNLDWDMWLGWQWDLAPRREWEPERYFRFRKFWDYSGGLATDLLYHVLGHLAIAVGPEFPSRVVASGGNYVFTLENDNREVPDTFNMTIDYPSGHTLSLYATQVNQTGVPDLVRGQYAAMHFGGPGIIIRPERPFRYEMAERARAGEFEGLQVFYGKDDRDREYLDRIEVGQEPRAEHFDNFLDCVVSREQPHLNADRAYQVMVPIALGVASYREKKAKLFDPEQEVLIQ